MSSHTRLYVLIAAVVALVAAAAAVAAVMSVSGGDSPSSSASSSVILPGTAETRALLRGIPQTGTTLGSPDAPVTLVEYADLQCPYCAAWATDAFPDLVKAYVRPGKLRIEFRGLAFIGPDSETALRAVIAAAPQTTAWQVIELLYQNQGTENTGWVTDELLNAVGRSAGLDVAAWRADFDSASVDAQIRAAATAADAKGIRSTPSFELGKTGGTLRRVEVTSLDAAGIRPAIEQALSG